MNIELTRIEASILDYFNKHGSVHIDKAKSDLKYASLELRIHKMSKLDYYNPLFKNSDKVGYLVEETIPLTDDERKSVDPIAPRSSGKYHISDYGKILIQDYHVQNKTDRISFIKKSIITPIAISLATTLLALLISWLLHLK